MLKLSKKNLVILGIINIFLVINKPVKLIAGGIVDSGHNMFRQTSADMNTEGLEGKAGVCSYCHIPHSASGYTMQVTAQNFATYYGEVGTICGTCHGVPTGKALAPNMTKSIYQSTWISFEQNHPMIDDNTDVYYDSGSASNELGLEEGGTQQWISGWVAAGRNHKNIPEKGGNYCIECTSCHDVHAVTPGTKFDINRSAPAGYNGTGASREFLRAKQFDTASTAIDASGDTYVLLGNMRQADISNPSLTRRQIFCEYCHVGRATAGWGPYNTLYVNLGGNKTKQFSTHPVGVGIVNGVKRAIRDDNKGWDTSILIPKQLMKGIDAVIGVLADTSMFGHLGGINQVADIGYEISADGVRDTTGVVICQTCHIPHRSTVGGQTHDGNFITGPKFMFETALQDLLVIGNRSYDGFNALCEACHSYRPFLKTKAEDPKNGDKDKTVGHPLKHSKYPGGSYNHDTNWETANMVSAACKDSDRPDGSLAIQIPSNWPTGGIPGLNSNEIVCLTCHDVHGAAPKTKLLRSIPLCNRCHSGPPRRLGISHPVNVSLVNSDGLTWPDQANLTIFTSQVFDKETKKVLMDSQPMYLRSVYPTVPDYDVYTVNGTNYSDIKYNPVVKIGCDTCHDWTNGNIHYQVAQRRDVQLETRWENTGDKWYKNNTRYAKDEVSRNTSNGHLHRPTDDPSHNSELCVSCHTPDNYNYDSAGISLTGEGVYAGANPSRFTMEYPIIHTGTILNFPIASDPKDLANRMEINGYDRLGTHVAQLRVLDVESERVNRLKWVYWKYWGDTSALGSRKRLDPNLNGSDTTCIMLSRKRSRWGQKFDSFEFQDLVNDFGDGPFLNTQIEKYRPIIICQSCHTPHFAAAGLVEFNTGAGKSSQEPTPHSALLYATQAESFMCRTCHLNGGNVAHPVNRPTRLTETEFGNYRGKEDDNYLIKMDIVNDTTRSDEAGRVEFSKGVAKTDTMHKLILTIEQERNRYFNENIFGAVHLRDTTTIYSQSWNISVNQGPLKPANYPRAGGSLNNPSNESASKNRGLPGLGLDTSSTNTNRSLLVCDSCHAPHSAGTPMGTYILEGNEDELSKAIYADSSVGYSNPPIANGSLWDGSAQPTRFLDDPTCLLCHPQ